MVVIDTSIWVDHLSAVDKHLSQLLDANRVLMHPWVVGELACGFLSNRSITIDSLRQLPQIAVANEEEVLFLIEQHKLMGHGIGYVDMHLLSSARLHEATVWSREKRLFKAAMDIKVAHTPPPGSGLLH